MTRYLYASNHAERLVAPGLLDSHDQPEEWNPVYSYAYERNEASCFYGFIRTAWRIMQKANRVQNETTHFATARAWAASTECKM